MQYNEYIVKSNYKLVKLLIGYSPNVYNSSKGGTYYNLLVHYDIPPCYLFNSEGITVSTSYGHYSLPRSVGLNSYNDYMLGFTKTIDHFVLGLQWTGTNGAGNDGTLSQDHFSATVLYNF